MSRHGSAACWVAHSGPPRWDATSSRRYGDGVCDGIWSTAVSFTSRFSAAC